VRVLMRAARCVPPGNRPRNSGDGGGRGNDNSNSNSNNNLFSPLVWARAVRSERCRRLNEVGQGAGAQIVAVVGLQAGWLAAGRQTNWPRAVA
jgi:hypothetical protein